MAPSDPPNPCAASTPLQKLAAFAVHGFTAAGATAAFLAMAAAVERDFAQMFVWLGVALVIDGVDGALARAADVAAHAPVIDGDRLDLVVDFLTYVFVPLFGLYLSGMFGAWGLPVCGLAMLSSAIYFADRRMKNDDNSFRGFPALWNVAALYLFVFAPSPGVATGIAIGLVLAMFAPVVAVHPLRNRRWRCVSLAASAVWLVSAIFAVAAGLNAAWLAKAGLLASGVYFAALSVQRMLQGNPR